MYRTYKYPLVVDRRDRRSLERIREGQRLLYNACLEERRSLWKWVKALEARGKTVPVETKRSLTRLDQYKSLTLLRKEGFYADLPVNLSRWTIERADLAFRSFFDRVKKGQTPGYPRFKSMNRWKSFGFVEHSGVVVDEAKHVIAFKGCRRLRFSAHRPFPEGGRIRSMTFTETVKGWSVALVFEIPDVAVSNVDDVVGIDLGITNRMVTSDGVVVDNPRLGRKAAKAVATLQRSLAAKTRGSKSRRHAVDDLRRVHLRLTDARRTTSRRTVAAMVRDLVRDGRGVALEDLSVRSMTRSAKGTLERPGHDVARKAGSNREFLDVAPGMMAKHWRDKAESAGLPIFFVDPRGTSRTCSSCGEDVSKDLSVRTHRCPRCGLVIDRDHNAAINIRDRGLVQLLEWKDRRTSVSSTSVS